jgi:hyperosmotically inducible protein
MTVVLKEPSAPPTVAAETRTVSYVPPRPRWPGLLALAVLVAGLTALAVSSYYDRRSPGEKIDATVQGFRDRVDAAVQGGAEAGGRAAAALGDAGTTAAVKAALATDPALSMLKIEVNTQAGVVSLSGPAPDERARERAAVLAAAPKGVVRVDNRLVVSPPAATPRN